MTKVVFDFAVARVSMKKKEPFISLVHISASFVTSVLFGVLNQDSSLTMIYIYIRISPHLYKCMYMHVNIFMYIYVHVYGYAYTRNVCINIYVDIYISF